MKSPSAMLEDAVRSGAFDSETQSWPTLRSHIIGLIEDAFATQFTAAAPRPRPTSTSTSARRQDTAETTEALTETERETETETETANETTHNEPQQPEPIANGPTDQQTTELKHVIDTLISGFPTAPPFTLQRLAELAKHPMRHHNTRDKYLRALSRVVSVESSIGEFRDFSNSDGTGFSTLGTNGNEPEVKLSPIEWLIDTGTPPPPDADETGVEGVATNGDAEASTHTDEDEQMDVDSTTAEMPESNGESAAEQAQ